MEKQWKQWQTLFVWAPKSLKMVIAAMKLKDTSWEKSYDQPRQHIKKQRHYFANKDPSSQGYGFSSSRVWMWELDYKECWAPKNWCFGELWCWRGLLRVPWTSRRSQSKSVLSIHWKDWCWSWNFDPLATWCKKLTHLKRPWSGKDWRWKRRGR